MRPHFAVVPLIANRLRIQALRSARRIRQLPRRHLLPLPRRELALFPRRRLAPFPPWLRRQLRRLQAQRTQAARRALLFLAAITTIVPAVVPTIVLTIVRTFL
jgi:hypothetical protein